MFQIDFSSRVPIYEQLYASIVKLSAVGVLKPGDRIPAVRVLATQLGVNPNTVAKSYKMLENSGYIYSTVGRGSFISDKLSKASAEKLLAFDELKDAIKKAESMGIKKEEVIELTTNYYDRGEF